MSKDNYIEQAENLAKAIDIAIIAFQNYPPKGFTQAQTDHVIKTYAVFKTNALNPEPQFKNSVSLKYIINDTFTYFQEAGGKTVDVFWEEIKNHALPYKRENKLSKVLRRGKIKNEIEYNFILDVIVAYQQEGLLKEDEIILLNKMIASFEQKIYKG